MMMMLDYLLIDHLGFKTIWVHAKYSLTELGVKKFWSFQTQLLLLLLLFVGISTTTILSIQIVWIKFSLLMMINAA